MKVNCNWAQYLDKLLWKYEYSFLISNSIVEVEVEATFGAEIPLA